MVQFEPLRPGEEEFPSAGPRQPGQSRATARYEGPNRNLPPVGSTEAQEQAWEQRTRVGEARRQRQSEAHVYRTTRAGQPYEGDDPVLQQVAEYGEEMHTADRRHDFMIGVGAFGRSMQTLTSFAGDHSNRLARASHRVPIMRHR